MDALKNLESSFISRLVKTLEDKIKKFLLQRNLKMSVLKNLESSFISHLVKTQEDKIYFAKRRYSDMHVFFPSVVCVNGRLPLLRFNSVFYYILSKIEFDQRDRIEDIKSELILYLIFRDNIHYKYLGDQNTFDTIARKHSERVYSENERFYLSIFSNFFSFRVADYPGFWEDEELYSDLSIFGYNNSIEEFNDLRRRLDGGPFYYEDNFGSNSIICKNGILTFQEDECVICKDAIPNMLFPNCGHIIVCYECYNRVDFERECPLCKIPIQLERKL